MSYLICLGRDVLFNFNVLFNMLNALLNFLVPNVPLSTVGYQVISSCFNGPMMLTFFKKKIQRKMLSQNPHVMIRSESSVMDLRGVSHDSFLDNLIFFNFMQIFGVSSPL